MFLLGTVNICRKFHYNPSNRFWVFPVWNKEVDQPTNQRTSISMLTQIIKGLKTLFTAMVYWICQPWQRITYEWQSTCMWVCVCVCVCAWWPAELIGQKTTCHHIFDWTQQGIRQHTAHTLLYQKNLLHAGKTRGVCLFVWLPVRLLRCQGLYSPTCPSSILPSPSLALALPFSFALPSTFYNQQVWD